MNNVKSKLSCVLSRSNFDAKINRAGVLSSLATLRIKQQKLLSLTSRHCRLDAMLILLYVKPDINAITAILHCWFPSIWRNISSLRLAAITPTSVCSVKVWCSSSEVDWCRDSWLSIFLHLFIVPYVSKSFGMLLKIKFIFFVLVNNILYFCTIPQFSEHHANFILPNHSSLW
jgi:hypothetical protein